MNADQHKPYEGIQLVTPDMASRWVSELNYKHQRQLRSYHVSALARMMNEGKFRQKTQVNFMRLEGEYILTNGQHTLRALALSGLPQVLSVIVSEANAWDDVADDFSRHDTHLTRRMADSLVAHECDAEFGVTRTQLQWITAASHYFAYMKSEISADSAVQATHDEKLSLVRKYGALGKRALGLFDGFYNHGFLVRRTTLASAMATVDRANDYAEQFWPLVASDDGLTLGDPRKTLRLWLAETTVGGGGYNGANRSRTVNAQECAKAIAICWNAWIEDRSLKLIRVDKQTDLVTFSRVGAFRVKGKPALQDAVEAITPTRKSIKPDQRERIERTSRA